MAMRALSDAKEIAAVPLDQPVLIELPMGVDDAGGDAEPKTPKKAKTPSNDGAKTMEEQLEAALAAQKMDRERADRAERSAQAAEARALQRQQEAELALRRASSLEGDVISGGLKAAQNDLAAAKAELVRAGEAGDYAAMAEAQARIGRASAQVITLESGAAEIAERAAAQKATPQPQPQPQPQQRQMSWSEQVQANPNLMTAEKDWMLAHEADFRDADFTRKLDFAYNGAMQKGLVRGSDEYFDHIEKATGTRANRNEKGVPVSSPVTRSERGTDGRYASSGVRLEPETRQWLKDNGIDEVDYVRQQQRLEAERRADPDRYSNRQS